MNSTEQPAVAGPVEPTVMQHSPGPWRLSCHPHDGNYMRITCSNDPAEGDNLRGYCGEANARLIVAAPDLLAALERLLASGDVRDAAEAGALKQARAAISKAVGSAA